MDIKLTQFSHGSGCGCKVAPAVLEEILSKSGDAFLSEKLLVGNHTNDDAAVYEMESGHALISTVDFFTPIVNDAFTFGKIAAANALSDVYAMGGKPFLALAVLGLPVEKLPTEIARNIIAGGKEICKQAGVSLAGGHTIDSPEPFFGLSVNGMVSVDHLKKNATAQNGDFIYLTKPLGTGMLTTALKRGLISEVDLEEAVKYMTTVNSFGEKLGQKKFVTAMTDVTGFGLIGHLIEMCNGAKLSSEIIYERVPLMNGVKELCTKFVYADNTMRNWKSYESQVTGIGSESLLTLCDPQTNGGLMIAVSPEEENQFLALAESEQCFTQRIGTFKERAEKTLYIQ